MPPRRYPRPTSVSVVCYLLIFRGAFELVFVLLVTFFPRNEPWLQPAPKILIVEQAIDAILSLLFAIFMLRGANWARIAFYVFAVLITFAFFSAQWNETALWAVFKLVIGGAFLATPAANRFFTGREGSRNRPEPDMPVREKSGTQRPHSRSRRRYDY